MATCINKVILVGQLDENPTTHKSKGLINGYKFTSLNVVTTERWADKNTGEIKSKNEWHRVVIFNERLIDLASNYFAKGTRIYVEGELHTRRWQDKEGNDRYTTEVVVTNFKGDVLLLSNTSNKEKEINNSNKNTSQEEDYEERLEERTPPKRTNSNNHGDYENNTNSVKRSEKKVNYAEILNDDIPF